MNVLVVDDEPFAHKLLALQLKKLGCQDVLSFECAYDALDFIRSGAKTIALIFCDLQMPRMDGIEFVRHLAGIGYGGGLVFVSGEEGRILQTAQALAKAHQLDILGTLNKPVATDLLGQVLERGFSRVATAPRSARKLYEPAELQRAISAGELVNYYQPKVEISTGTVTGMETLVRWQHPQDGLVFPDQFIATAEQFGLINDLTRAVMPAALHQARLWQAMGLDLHVAVNVSMDNLTFLEFPDFVARAVSEAGVPLSSLVLEVTESRLMKDPRLLLDILTRLRLKRIGLSIDDFGTGHSSLAQLRDIPFDELKIDRSFTHGASRNTSLRAIFEASLSMARQLGMKTVAEGVEDRADWDFLRAAGCDSAQGYFIGKPMPATEVPSWMSAWKVRSRELVASTMSLS